SPAPAFGKGLVYILFVEVQDIAGARAIEDSAHRQFEVTRINVAGERYAVPDLKMKRICEITADDTGRPLEDERLLLVLENAVLTVDLEKVFRLDCEPREHIFGIAVIFVYATEPVVDHHFPHARDLLDARLVGQRNRYCERDLVARDEPESFIRR